MKHQKKHKIKTTTFSLLLLIVIVLLFLFNCEYVLASDSFDTLNDSYICKDSVIIIPPEGSEFTDISNTYVSIQLNNNSKIINISDTVDSFSKITFHKSIDGLDEFNIKINFDDYKSKYINIVSYTVNWGNDEVYTGVSIPSTLSYTYKKEGKYPINIKFTDSDGISYTTLKNQSFKLSTGKYVELWVGENKEPIAAGSAGIGSLALLGFAITETGKYKLLALLPLLIPLYTRIQKDDVLDQFVRGQIYGFIKSNPGAHYNQIIRELNIKNGTLSYHLSVLEKMEIIKSRKEGIRYHAFYPTGIKFPDKERYRLTELQINIIDIIKNNKGISQKEISKKLNKKCQTINYNIKVLQQADLILLQKNGRRTSCFVM